MNHPTLSGILPVLPATFDDAGKIDLEAMERVTRFCLNAGAHGLVFPGVASEFDYLTRKERLAFLEVICQTTEGSVQIVCGGGKGTPKEIAENIREVVDLGVCAAMVLIPPQFKNDLSGAKKYIMEVIEGAPGIDIILQNAPSPIGAGLDPVEITSIVAESPAIRYVKEEALPSGPRISALREAAPDHLVGVMGGGGARYLIDEMNRGAIAALPAAEITDLHVRMWNAHQKGDVKQARELYRATLPLLAIQMIYRMRLTKLVLTWRGVLDNAVVRAPLPEFDSFDRAEISAQLEYLAEFFQKASVETASN